MPLNLFLFTYAGVHVHVNARNQLHKLYIMYFFCYFVKGLKTQQNILMMKKDAFSNVTESDVY